MKDIILYTTYSYFVYCLFPPTLYMRLITGQSSAAMDQAHKYGNCRFLYVLDFVSRAASYLAYLVSELVHV